MTSILVPVDFGDSSDAALRAGAELARRFDAHLILMHACDVATYAYPVYPVPPLSDVAGTVQIAARKALDAEVARTSALWPKLSSTLRIGKPWREIVDVAERERVSLIVMGTHGRRGVTRALLGSVAERVLRVSMVPVLTVRGATHDAARPAFDDEDETSRYERRLAHPSAATIEATTLSGAAAGATLGAFGGPAGAIAGAWVGTAVGAAAAVVLDEDEARARASTAKLDEEIGIIGGDIGAKTRPA